VWRTLYSNTNSGKKKEVVLFAEQLSSPERGGRKKVAWMASPQTEERRGLPYRWRQKEKERGGKEKGHNQKRKRSQNSTKKEYFSTRRGGQEPSSIAKEMGEEGGGKDGAGLSSTIGNQRKKKEKSLCVAVAKGGKKKRIGFLASMSEGKRSMPPRITPPEKEKKGPSLIRFGVKAKRNQKQPRSFHVRGRKVKKEANRELWG